MTGLRRFGPLLAVGLLLAAAAVAAALSTPQVSRLPIGPQGTPAPPEVRVDDTNAHPPSPRDVLPTEPSRSVEGSTWLIAVAQVLCLAFALVVLVLLIWYLVRTQRVRTRRVAAPAEPARLAREEVLAAVEASLITLAEEDADPRQAVIVCWVRLEQAAAAAGTPRAPGDTPAELVTRLLAGHQVSAAVLYALAEVYRLARYATHTVDTVMRDQARAALQQLRTELSPTGVAS
jgi:hypothetical protein